MEARVAAIHAGEASERVWLLEHPPLYTAGVSAKDEDLIDARFPVHRTGRGGQFTYHGPGQRVGYVMLNLAERGREFFVRASAQVMDEAGLDREQISAALSAEAQDLWDSGSLAEVMPVCLGLLPAE